MSFLRRKKFVFIIGAPRSGTTWLHKMIADHKGFFSLNGSNTFLQHYILPLEKMYLSEKTIFKDRGFTRGLPSKISQKEFYELLADYIQRFYSTIPDEKEYYIEKATDLTDVIHRIKKFIPNAKFIHIIRDGRNATISEIKLREKYGAPMGIDNVYNGALKWKKQVIEARINAEEFKNDYLEVHYEDLFANTQLCLSKIFRFIGVEPDVEETERISQKFNYKNNSVSMPTTDIAKGNGQILQPFKKEMTKTQLALFEYLAGDALKTFNYKLDSTSKASYYRFYVKFIWLPVSSIKRKLNVAKSIINRNLGLKS